MKDNSTNTLDIFLIPIDELYQQQQLSGKAFNICQQNNLLFLGSILLFWYEHKYFSFLPGVGIHTDKELLNLCSYYLSLDEVSAYFALKDEENRPFLLDKKLTANQIKKIDAYIELQFRQLPTRIYRGLSYYLKHEINYQTLQKASLFNRNKRFKLHQVGIEASKEVYEHLDAIKEYALLVSQSEDDETEPIEIKEETVIAKKGEYKFDYRKIKEEKKKEHELILSVNAPDFVVTTYQAFKITLKTLPLEMSKIDNNAFPFFKLLENAILQAPFFDKRNKIILKHRFKLFQDHEILKLDKIAQDFNITRERIRQLETLIVRELNSKFRILSREKESILKHTNYAMDFSADLVAITPRVEKMINDREHCSVTTTLIAQVWSAVYSDSHSLADIFENSKTHYLIHVDLYYVFDFKFLIKDLLNIYRKTKYEDFVFNWKEYLSNFTDTNDATLLNRCQLVVEKLMSYEFTEGVKVTEDSFMFLQTKDKKTQAKYFVEVFEEIGQPMALFDVVEKVNLRSPTYTYDLTSAYTVMDNHRDIFIYVGSKGIYGLRKWETERIDVKGGGIRDMIEAYLEQFDEPRQIDEIVGYVQIYRPSASSNSIRTNMGVDKERFLSFSNHFWGLTTKGYDLRFLNELPAPFSYSLKKALKLHEDKTEAEFLQILEDEYHLHPTQLNYCISLRIKRGILYRENDKIKFYIK